MADVLRTGTFRGAAMVWAGVALVLLAGSRHLITRGIPAVGELVELSTEPMDLLRSFASGWRTAGLGAEASAPPPSGCSAPSASSRSGPWASCAPSSRWG